MNCPFCGREMEPGELRLTGASIHRAALDGPEASWMPLPGQTARGRLVRDEAKARPLALALGKKTLRETLGLAPDVWNDRFYLQNTWYCADCRKAVCVLEGTNSVPDAEAGRELVSGPEPEAAPAQAPSRETRERAPWERREKPPWEK